jgi:hypothetical protein
MSKTYVITNLDGYVSQMRDSVANSILENNSDNLDDYISLDQIKGLVYQSCLGTDIEDHPFIDENVNESIFESVRTWIYNVGLARLASAGHIECAWDDDTSEMIFWKSENQNRNNPDESSNQNTTT